MSNIIKRIENSEIMLNIKKYNKLYENNNYNKDDGEDIIDLIEKAGIPYRDLEVNEKGHIIVDKDKDPDLYDWWLNG